MKNKEKFAEVLPVVRAHWECLQPILVSTYECSKCGFDINLNESLQNINRYMKFCPHCGAKMDEKIEEKK